MKRNIVLMLLALLIFGVLAFYAFAQNPNAQQQKTAKRFVLLQSINLTLEGDNTVPSFQLCPDISPYHIYRNKGKALVELKDGSVKEFDLENVKTVVLQ
jgi:hypothetical protein